jgi:hypothetical protein
MKHLISILKGIRLKQILGICLAAVLLVVTTACSGPSNAAVGPGNAASSNTAKSAYHGKDTTENYVDLNERPGRNSAAVKGQTDRLKQAANRSMIDMTGDVGENTQRTLDRKGDNARQFGRNVQQSTNRTADEAAESAKDLQRASERGTRNLSRNADRAAEATERQADRVGRNAADAADTAQSKVRQGASGARQAAEDAASNLSGGA